MAYDEYIITHPFLKDPSPGAHDGQAAVPRRSEDILDELQRRSGDLMVNATDELKKWFPRLCVVALFFLLAVFVSFMLSPKSNKSSSDAEIDRSQVELSDRAPSDLYHEEDASRKGLVLNTAHSHIKAVSAWMSSFMAIVTIFVFLIFVFLNGYWFLKWRTAKIVHRMTRSDAANGAPIKSDMAIQRLIEMKVIQRAH